MKSVIAVIGGMEQDRGNNPCSAWISICSDERPWQTSIGELNRKVSDDSRTSERWFVMSR
jgi:hypothetical protein